MCPREAYFAKKEVVSIKESIGKIAGESIMVYPPGIPIVSLGEEITEEIIEYIAYIKGENASFANSYDKTLEHVKVIMG
jgi:arginine/lysine/ornithine decarboxylase